MDKADVDKLLKQGTKDERIRLTTLYNAAVETLKTYQVEKNKSALVDWEATEKSLEAYAGKLKEKYEPADGPPLKNIPEMVEYLQDAGYRIKKSKVYQDSKKGLFRKNEDGSIPISEVLSYAVKAGLKTAAPGPDRETAKYHAKKLREEIKGLQLKNEKLEQEVFKNRGELISRDDAETERAVNLATFDAAVRHMVRTRSPDWMVQAGKDPAKLRQLIEEDLDLMSNELAKQKEIMIELANP